MRDRCSFVGPLELVPFGGRFERNCSVLTHAMLHFLARLPVESKMIPPETTRT